MDKFNVDLVNMYTCSTFRGLGVAAFTGLSISLDLPERRDSILSKAATSSSGLGKTLWLECIIQVKLFKVYIVNQIFFNMQKILYFCNHILPITIIMTWWHKIIVEKWYRFTSKFRRVRWYVSKHLQVFFQIVDLQGIGVRVHHGFRFLCTTWLG